MADFGRTWWGQQWLAAFDGIDHSNRLPRGRRYANNGSVRAIDIGNTAVKARVLGSRPTPYKVDVALSQFSKEQRKTVLETAEASPALLSRLLNRQLPAHVLKLLENTASACFPGLGVI